jgi:hypothetical protein
VSRADPADSEDDSDAEPWPPVEELEEDDTGSGWRFSRIADKVNTVLLTGLVAVYVGHRVAPGFGVPDLASVFPAVAGVAAAVAFAAYGLDAGILPTTNGPGGGERP